MLRCRQIGLSDTAVKDVSALPVGAQNSDLAKCNFATNRVHQSVLTYADRFVAELGGRVDDYMRAFFLFWMCGEWWWASCACTCVNVCLSVLSMSV